MWEEVLKPWPWYVVGPLIAIVMFAMLFFGKRFGVSSNLRTLCAIGGGGKFAEFFRFDWKKDIWNLLFIGGSVIGGFIATEFLSVDSHVPISPETISDLKALGLSNPGGSLVPSELISWEALFSLKGFVTMIVGGFLVGFGTRYAGGCTSGHAISGLSNLQLPSLIAVVGFFIGGLAMTYFILPFILKL